MTRKYLPTSGDLIDRLSIVMLKMIYIPEHREAYVRERDMIEHDLNETFNATLDAKLIRAILVVMLANVTIWRNESAARNGGSSQDHLLRFTHSINGVRNTAKNVIAKAAGERVDAKIDALAADLPSDMGNWNVFE